MVWQFEMTCPYRQEDHEGYQDKGYRTPKPMGDYASNSELLGATVSGDMVLEGDFVWLQVAQVVATSLIGLFGLSAAMNGHLFEKINPVFRVLFAAGGVCMMVPDTLTDVIGIALIVALFVVQFLRRKRSHTPAEPPAAAAA